MGNRSERFRADRLYLYGAELRVRLDRSRRHAYHVLLTRARSGIVIYSEDEGTRNALRTLISGTVADSPLAKPKKKLPPLVTEVEQAVAQQLTIEFD